MATTALEHPVVRRLRQVEAKEEIARTRIADGLRIHPVGYCPCCRVHGCATRAALTGDDS